MDEDEAMLEDARLDDGVDPGVGRALPLRLAALDPVEERVHLVFDDAPGRRLVVDDGLARDDVAHARLLPPERPRTAPAAAHAGDEGAMKVQEVAPGEALVASAMQRLDRLEGLEVVAELALAELVGQLEGLLERQRVALDLDAGECFADVGLAADVADPLGAQAHGGEEAAGALDGVQLAEDAGGEGVGGLEPREPGIGGVGESLETSGEHDSTRALYRGHGRGRDTRGEWQHPEYRGLLSPSRCADRNHATILGDRTLMEDTPTTALGRLKSVDLRAVWTREAEDFTPWLARDQNIALLGNSIGLDLEVEAQEKDVGPFRADILCKNTADDSWVLIENQLERTDHTHLGQLLTYASGLSAVTIVWVASRFTNEHRAALDWLNDITSDDFNFFGLEVELWRIGDSAIAPKFNIVSNPNDWTKNIASAAHNLKSNAISDTKRLQHDYWQSFRRLMEERGGLVRPTKPRPQNWQSFTIGRTNFHLTTLVNTVDSQIGVALVLSKENAKPHFHLLQEDRSAIESEIGEALEWDELPTKTECRIRLRWQGCDPTDRSAWSTQHEWLYERLQRFHHVFGARVKDLDASELPAAGDD